MTNLLACHLQWPQILILSLLQDWWFNIDLEGHISRHDTPQTQTRTGLALPDGSHYSSTDRPQAGLKSKGGSPYVRSEDIPAIKVMLRPRSKVKYLLDQTDMKVLTYKWHVRQTQQVNAESPSPDSEWDPFLFLFLLLIVYWEKLLLNLHIHVS